MTATRQTPLIGITGRRLRSMHMAGADARYGERCIDIFWSDFAQRVTAAGAIPVHLPFEAAAAGVVPRLDGLIITGGQDVRIGLSPLHEDDKPTPADPRDHPQVPDRERDAYEIALVHDALDGGVPLLGICRGAQLLNVALGGTLIPDIESPLLVHNQPESAPFNGAESHVVHFCAGSLAASLYGERAIVNSWHHQAVDRCAESLVVSARAVDGIVESIEWPGRPVLGLQWHPEWRPELDPVFTWLVSAASQSAPAPRSSSPLKEDPS